MSGFPKLPKFLDRKSWSKKYTEDCRQFNMAAVKKEMERRAKEQAAEEVPLSLNEDKPEAKVRKARPRQTKVDEAVMKALGKKLKRRKK